MDQEAVPISLTADAPSESGAAETGERPKTTPVSEILVAEQKRAARAKALCDRAGDTDVLYLGVLGALDVGSVLFDANVGKQSVGLPLRLAGPAFVGLAWGATLGALPLAVPQCTTPGTPLVRGPEASTHSELPLMITLSVFAGATAPFLVGLEQGPVPRDWPVVERSGRLISAGVAGAVGALIPYVIPPKPFRAIRELRGLDVAVSPTAFTLRLEF